MDNERPEIGHNRPPEPVEELRAHLRATHLELMERADELLGLADRLPAPEEMSDDWADKIAEAVKSCTTFVKHCEASRLAANEPHRALIKATDAFFKGMSDRVIVLKDRMAHRYLTPWQKKRENEERRRREAAAAEALRIAGEETARAFAEAAALRKIKAAEEAAEDAAELERLAAERVEQERLAAEALERAKAADQERHVTERAAAANAAAMSRSRTDLGAVASLKTTWGFNITDPAQVPRPYLSVNESAIRAAIVAATKGGVCELQIPGVEIFPITHTVVR